MFPDDDLLDLCERFIAVHASMCVIMERVSAMLAAQSEYFHDELLSGKCIYVHHALVRHFVNKKTAPKERFF